MTKISLVLLFVIAVMFLAPWARAEKMYFTFVRPGQNAPLQKEQLLLKIDGKPQAVEDFFISDTANRNAQQLAHPAGRRHYILVFDLIFGRPNDLLEGRKLSEAFLNRLGKDDLISICAIAVKSGLKFYSTFTTDRDKVIFALNAIGKDRLNAMIEGPDGNLYSDSFAAKVPATLIPEDEFLRNIAAPEIKKDKRTIFIQEFVELASALSTVEGRKNIILFSPGFDAGGVYRIQEQRAWKEPELTPSTPASPPQQPEPKLESLKTSSSFSADDLIEFASGSDCHVHIIQGEPKENDFYKKLSSRTRALYFKNENNPTAAIDQILATDSQFYVIGWNDKSHRDYRELHSLKLEAGEDKILSMGTWIVPKPYAEYSAVEKKINISEAIYKNYEPPGNEQHFYADFELAQGVAIVSSFVQISGSEILRNDDSSLEISTFLLGPNGSLIDFNALPYIKMDLNNSTLKERLNANGIKGWSVMLAEPGKTVVRWIITNGKTGKTITDSIPLEIQDSALTITNPFFPANNFDWIVWPRPPDQKLKRGIRVEYPYRFGENYFFPDLSPVFTIGAKTRVLYFKIYNLPGERKYPPIKMYLQGPNGSSTEIQDFMLKEQPRELDHVGTELFWNIHPPQDVPPGFYHFVVKVTDTTKNQEVLQSLELQVNKEGKQISQSIQLLLNSF